MYGCGTIRTWTNRTPMMEDIAKMVNDLSRWLLTNWALS